MRCHLHIEYGCVTIEIDDNLHKHKQRAMNEERIIVFAADQ